MGNRALIKAKGEGRNGLYLHWNGGIDSVTAFLAYCELQGFRGLPDCYALARLAQVTGNFFPDGLSVGIWEEADDPGDNGIYEVEGWKIVRHVLHGVEIAPDMERHEGYDLIEMLREIDKCQPAAMQFMESVADPFFPVEKLKVGDKIAVKWLGRSWHPAVVGGFGEAGKLINGLRVEGIPFFMKDCDDVGDAERNCNNYLTSNTCILLKD